MPHSVKFEGTVVRVERGGFGIVEFKAPLGAGANTHGVFSPSATAIPYADLQKGMHVVGRAEVDDKDLAAITELGVEHGR